MLAEDTSPTRATTSNPQILANYVLVIQYILDPNHPFFRGGGDDTGHTFL
jgi:hypothetical protein